MRVSRPHGAQHSWRSQRAGLLQLNRKENTLLDDGLGRGELCLHVNNVLFGLAQVVFGLGRLLHCLVQLGLFRQELVVEVLQLCS